MIRQRADRRHAARYARQDGSGDRVRQGRRGVHRDARRATCRRTRRSRRWSTATRTPSSTSRRSPAVRRTCSRRPHRCPRPRRSTCATSPRSSASSPIETDLGEIQAEPRRQSEATIARLEGVFAAGDTSRGVSGARAHGARGSTQIQDDLIAIRNDLADNELRLVDSPGELAQLTATRKQLAQQYATMPNPRRRSTSESAATKAQLRRDRRSRRRRGQRQHSTRRRRSPSRCASTATIRRSKVSPR